MESFRISSPVETPNTTRGFTLVEMLVVLTIIVIITAVALFGQSKFNQSLILSDTAYTVAFSIRQAQSYGLSSRITSNQSIAYGVHFSTVSTPGPSAYYFFADLSPYTAKPSNCKTGTAGTPDYKPGNCIYDYNDDIAEPNDSIIQTYTFSRQFYIDRICGREDLPGSAILCSSDSPAGLQRISIAFLRPNTDVVITGVRPTTALVPLRNAAIRVSSPDGVAWREICVSSVGQIYVASGACPL